MHAVSCNFGRKVYASAQETLLFSSLAIKSSSLRVCKRETHSELKSLHLTHMHSVISHVCYLTVIRLETSSNYFA